MQIPRKKKEEKKIRVFLSFGLGRRPRRVTSKRKAHPALRRLVYDPKTARPRAGVLEGVLEGGVGKKKEALFFDRGAIQTLLLALVFAKVECICEASSPKHPHHIIGEKKRKKALSSLFQTKKKEKKKKKKKKNADIFAKKLLFHF